MIFETAKRIETSKSPEEVISYLHESFSKISKSVEKTDSNKLLVSGIEASFGSINRKDRGTVLCERVDGGVVVKAEIAYTPSLFFWAFLVFGLFTYVVWLIPIAFYLIQKNSVKSAMESVLQKANEELRASQPQPGPNSLGSELEKLVALKDRGVLTQQEFDAQKSKLLA